MNSISINCNICGHCCNGGPALSIKEMFKYQNQFIIGIRYAITTPIAKNLPWATPQEISAIHQTLNIFTPAIANRRGEQSHLLITPCVTDYSLTKGNSCTALDKDGKCKLHNDKPAMCKCVPFDPVFPVELQDKHIRKNCKHLNCITTNSNENIIWRNGDFVDNSDYAVGFNKRLSDLQGEFEVIQLLFETFIKENKSSLLLTPSLEEIKDATKSGGLITSCTAGILFILYLFNKDKKDIKKNLMDFLTSQNILIETEMQAALQRQNRNEREITNQLRGYLKNNREFSRILQCCE